MAFISNKERFKTQKSLYKGYGFKKLVIFTTLIISIICAVYILLGILAQLHVIEAWQIQFVKDSTGSEWKLTAYGIVACVLVAIVLLGGLCSIIMLFTMASPYKITDKVSKLSSSALSGRKNSSAASRTTGERY